MKRSGVLLLPVLLVLGMARSAPAEDPPPSFTKDITPFLKSYCVECPSGARAKSGVMLDSYKGIMQDSRKKSVVASKPDQSRMLSALQGQGKPMPPKKYAKQPTAKEIAVVKAWIAAGAKDDSATQGLLPPGLKRDRWGAETLWAALVRRENEE